MFSVQRKDGKPAVYDDLRRVFWVGFRNDAAARKFAARKNAPKVDGVRTRPLTETEQAVADLLQARGVEFEAVHVGAGLDSSGWCRDAWRVTFAEGARQVSLDYHTGLGRRIEAGASGSFAVSPSAAEVLYAMADDGQAADMTHAQFCDEYGYDPDSRAALELYLQCQENGVNYCKMFTAADRETIAKLLADY